MPPSSSRPLIGRADRTAAWLWLAVGAAVAIALAALVWHRGATSFDTWVWTRVQPHFGAVDALKRRWWLWLSEPVVSFCVPAAVVVVAAVRRHWRLAIYGALGPLLALAVAELGKVVVHRLIGAAAYTGTLATTARGSYPSGHETGTVAWLMLLLVVLFRGTRRVWPRFAAVVVAALWAAGAAVGLTINFYHYATDTVGAAGATIAVMLGLALATDAAVNARAPSSPADPGRPRTARAA